MVTTSPPKTIVKPTTLGPVANTDTKFLIYGLFQKGRVLAQDGVLSVQFGTILGLIVSFFRLIAQTMRRRSTPRSRLRRGRRCFRNQVLVAAA